MFAHHEIDPALLPESAKALEVASHDGAQDAHEVVVAVVPGPAPVRACSRWRVSSALRQEAFADAALILTAAKLATGESDDSVGAALDEPRQRVQEMRGGLRPFEVGHVLLLCRRLAPLAVEVIVELARRLPPGGRVAVVERLQEMV